MRQVRELEGGDDGATMVEYGLLLGIVMVATIAVRAFGLRVTGLFDPALSLFP